MSERKIMFAVLSFSDMAHLIEGFTEQAKSEVLITQELKDQCYDLAESIVKLSEDEKIPSSITTLSCLMVASTLMMMLIANIDTSSGRKPN